MVRRVLPLVALVALFSFGCVPVTEPVGDVDKAEPEKALVGTWQEKEKAILKIDIPEVKGNPKGLMRATFVEDKDFRPIFWFVVTTVGKEKLVNLIENEKNVNFSKEGEYAKWAAGKDRAYYVSKYHVEKDELVLDMGDEKAFKGIADEAKLMQEEREWLNRKATVYVTPKDWLTNYITKNGSAKIFPGLAGVIKLTRAKK